MNSQSEARPFSDPLIRDQEVTLEQVGDQAILYDRRNGQAHVLNASAARLWELCDGESAIDQVTERFASGYGMPADAVRADVEQLIASFRNLGVLS